MICTLNPSRVPLFCVVLCQFFTTLQAYGQFTTVLNIPPDPDIGHAGIIGSDTQLNLADGGAVGTYFRAGASDGTSTNVEVNISGGTVGSNFYAYNGSEVNISGGTVGRRFVAFDGSTVNISGGSVLDGGSFAPSFTALDGSTVNLSGGSTGRSFRANSGSTINLSGGSVGDLFRANTGSTLNISGREFRLDGVLIGELETVGNSLQVNLPFDSVLSGTLANGNPFAFTSLDRDEIDNGTLTLSASTLPPLEPAVIVLPMDPVPLGVRGGQTLVVLDSGTVGDNFNAGLGSTVVVTGGQVDNNFEAVGAQVRIAGGSVGNYFDAFSGSEVTISGGSVGNGFDAHNGSTVNISGGSVGSFFSAYPGSIVNLSGGSSGTLFRANSGSTVNVSGGSVGVRFRSESGSTVNLSGGEFRLDGVPIAGLEAVGDSLPVNLLLGSVLSGTLADGTPFAFQPFNRGFHKVGDDLADGTLTLTTAALPPIGPPVITLPSDPVPLGVRAGQTLVVNDGGVVADNFHAGLGSTVVVTGGQVGNNFEAVGTQVRISGGSVGYGFDAYNGSTVDISGGSVGHYLDAYNGSTVDISGGSVGKYFGAFSGSTVNLSGGSLGDHFSAGSNDGSSANVLVNVSGGTVGKGFNAYNGSTVNVSGGSVGISFWANNGSDVNISGGSVGSNFGAAYGSTVGLSGGTFGSWFYAAYGSTVGISGGEFRLDGVPITGLETIGNTLAVNLPSGSALSGTFADGTPFAFDGNRIDDGVLTLTASTLPAVGPGVILLPSDPIPQAIRTGQTLVVTDGGAVGDNFRAGWGSTVVVTGGQVGNNFEAIGAQVRITGGSVDSRFRANSGSTVDISGGTVGDGFNAFDGSTVNVSGGTVGDGFVAYSGSMVNISGGTFGPGFGAGEFAGDNTHTKVNISGGTFGPGFRVGKSARGDAEIVVNISGGTFGPGFRVGKSARGDAEIVVNISGGTFGDNFDVFKVGEVNLFGTEFVVDTSDITASLTPGVPFTISDRNVTLSGLLTDGSPFSFDLSASNGFTTGYFDPLATLTVTLALPGLFDGDWDVDGMDFLTWQRGKSPNPFSSGDLAVWEANYGTDGAPLSSDAAAVPEPSSLLLAAIMLQFAAIRVRGRENPRDRM